MKKVVLIFGLISGSIMASSFAISFLLFMDRVFDFEKSEVLGYTSMVLAFLLVFFGIRSYRQNIGHGVITFGRAFQVGILITLIACAFYVISWEIVYFNFMPDFVDKYAAHTIEKLRASGATEAAIAAAKTKMADFKKLYANPFINVAMTFMEVFPVGLIVTAVSAAILRRKTPPSAAAVA